MPTATRLPGIQFEVVTPASPTALPRMDIAVLVGFAASGPLSVPVAVEDIAHFEEVFGDDLVLVQAGNAGTTAYAYLAPAVRAFFRNGGRRCWVIRVAGTAAASGVFPIPGLSLLSGSVVTPAQAMARSEGSWADGISVAASLNSEPVVVAAFNAAAMSLTLVPGSPSQVQPGDLLRLTFPGRQLLWFFVGGLTPGGQAVTATAAQWFLPAGSMPASTRPLCEIVTMDFFVMGGPGELWTLTDLGFAPAHARYWASLPDDRTLYSPDFPADQMAALIADAAHPRFPLAGPEQASRFYLPLGVTSLPGDFAGPLATTADPLVRDGLASFNSSLFLDPGLAGTLSTDLQNEADFIRYGSGSTRALTGIHAAFALEEATIIAVPDAVQPGWVMTNPAAPASPLMSSPLLHPEWWPSLECGNQAIPRTSAPPSGQFLPCDLEIIPAPALAASQNAPGQITITWQAQAG
ncbi:MAG: hypothetical protein M3N54_09985, partial [Acidobacteriota bacterium]|nr:hypothetical protein [Acidobacteriota bacterium]